MRKVGIILAMLLLLLSGCSPKPQKYSRSEILLFDTAITLSAYSGSQAEFDKISEICFDEFERLSKLFDIYKSYEGVANLCDINSSAGVAPVEVDIEIIKLIEMGIRAYKLTGGKVNIAFGSVLELWSEGRKQGHAPDIAELKAANAHTDINAVKVEGNTVFITDKDASIDVGAVAKGFATQLAADKLMEAGCRDFVISAGGNVIAMGAAPGGDRWKVGVQSPDDSAGIAAVLEVSDLSVVSSGGYLRYFEENGTIYHHIIDPKTLMPSDGLKSATVIYKDSGIADVLSTACFMMDAERARELIDGVDGASAIFIDKDGAIIEVNR